jgi:hypothetical protein
MEESLGKGLVVFADEVVLKMGREILPVAPASSSSPIRLLSGLRLRLAPEVAPAASDGAESASCPAVQATRVTTRQRT